VILRAFSASIGGLAGVPSAWAGGGWRVLGLLAVTMYMVCRAVLARRAVAARAWLVAAGLVFGSGLLAAQEAPLPRTAAAAAAPDSAAAEPANASPLADALRPGDRLALVGGTLWELKQEYGELETLLAARWWEWGLSFRNTSWSGDDASGVGRGVFGGQSEGYQRRLRDLQMAQPTWVVLGYGQAEAADDQRWSIDAFEQALGRLMGDLSAAGYRIALVPPHPVYGPPHLADRVAVINERVEAIGQRIRRLADQHGGLWLPLPAPEADDFDDWLRLHPAGKQRTLLRWGAALVGLEGIESRQALNRLVIPAEGAIAFGPGDDASRASIAWERLPADAERVRRWREVPQHLPDEGLAEWTPMGQQRFLSRQLVIEGLPAGEYRLWLGDEPLLQADAAAWQAGVSVDGWGVDRQRQQLQAAIRAKNDNFFHAYRPQNETYLFLFRKHEQGNNAVDVERFLELTQQGDDRIRELAVPQPSLWSLERL
jgi:hypothetical protein